MAERKQTTSPAKLKFFSYFLLIVLYSPHPVWKVQFWRIKPRTIQAFLQYLLTSYNLPVTLNVQKSKAVIRNESLMTVMSGDDHIVRAFVTTDGAPTVSISTHKSYTYSSDLGCWIILYDKQDVIHHSSDHHSCTPPVLVDKPGPLASLASSSNRLGMQGGRIFSVDQSLQQVTTINHLESQMAASLSLQSGSEYKFWLQTYVRYLAKEGLETKIREVCDDLLGPVYKSKGSSSWDSYILGMKKRELLHGILPNIGSNLQLQRLFTEYQEQLETIEK